MMSSPAARPGLPRRLPRLVLAAGVMTFLAGAAQVSLAADPPQRVLSIGGAVTETVYALEAGDRVIAVDSTSLYPPQARQHPDVGYMRTLSAEAILAMQPDLILAIEGAGPPVVLSQIQAAGVELAMIPNEPTPEGVLAKVRAVAEALGEPAKGEALAARLEVEFDELAEHLSGLRERPSLVFLLSISGGGPPQAAGRETAADGIIRLSGGENAITGFQGYRPLSPEAMVALDPDVILITLQGLEALGGREAVLARPEIAATRAGRQGRLLAMDTLLLLGFGPRTPMAVRELAGSLHPDLALAGGQASGGAPQ